MRGVGSEQPKRESELDNHRHSLEVCYTLHFYLLG
jgi:hypothetical protein